MAWNPPTVVDHWGPDIRRIYSEGEVSHRPVLKYIKMNAHARDPQRSSLGAAGFDLFSAETIALPPRRQTAISTGLKVQVPDGTYGRIAPRSGLANLYFIDVLAGVIDPDFRGEVKVLLANHAQVEYLVHEGERIAQLVLERIIIPDLQPSIYLDPTPRGISGLGSTGRF